MNRIRVLLSLGLLVAAAALASAASVGPGAAPASDGACSVNSAACPPDPNCCEGCCPLPCAPASGEAAVTAAVR